MKIASKIVEILSRSCLMLPMACVAAPAPCTGNFSDSAYSKAASAIVQWQASTGVVLTINARNLTLESFCQATTSIIDDGKAKQADIDSMSSQIIGDYLGPHLSEQPGRSMGAIIRARVLKVSGLSLPQAKRLGLLTVNYSIPELDTLSVGSDTFTPTRPSQRLLVPVGRVAVKGFKKSSVVCTRDIELQPGIEGTVQC